MTPRTAVGALGLLAAAFVAAACGGGTNPTAAPTQAAIATLPAATPTAVPGPTEQPLPSFVLPSIHGNVDLEKLIPTTIGGEPIVTLSMTGQDFVGSGSDTELDAVLTALNKQPSDLSVAFGGNSQVQIVAFQINGVPGSQILQAFYNASKSTLDATLSDTTIAGKPAKKLTPTDTTQFPSYIYAKNDVVFSIAGPGDAALTDAVLTEAFQKLP
jgi:hypothetical protein